MSNLRRNWKRWFWRLALIAPFVVLLWAIAVTIFRPSPLQELAAARERWQSQNIDSYRMTISYFGGGYTMPTIYGLQVDDGLVTSADTRPILMSESQVTPIPDPMNYTLANPPSNPDFTPSRLDQLTVEGMFTFAESALADETWPGPFECRYDWHHEADFDAQYGYIRQLRYTNCSTSLLCSAISHCETSVTVTEFEPLAD